jgi:outer membrane protein
MGNSMQRSILNASSLLVLAAALGGAVASAQAADLAPVYKKAPVVDAWNPWMIRVRALGVLPDASGSTVNVFGVPALSSPNSGLSIGNSVVPELDISYFFTRNIAAELILGVTKHSITGTGTLDGLNVGKAWLLPPTLTLQYHFTDFGAFKPYIGAGVNYTMFFNQSAGNTVLGGLAVTQLHISNSFGAVAQVGFDYMLDRHWGLNFDVKKIFLEPDYSATVNNAIPVSGTAHINPWLVAGGVTYKF